MVTVECKSLAPDTFPGRIRIKPSFIQSKLYVVVQDCMQHTKRACEATERPPKQNTRVGFFVLDFSTWRRRQKLRSEIFAVRVCILRLIRCRRECDLPETEPDSASSPMSVASTHDSHPQLDPPCPA